MGASKLIVPGGEIEKRRRLFSEQEVQFTLAALEAKWRYRLNTKGFSGSTSRHEIYGIILEEVRELENEVFRIFRSQNASEKKSTNFEGEVDAICDELLDVAVAALWGYVSILAETTDF